MPNRMALGYTINGYNYNSQATKLSTLLQLLPRLHHFAMFSRSINKRKICRRREQNMSIVNDKIKKNIIQRQIDFEDLNVKFRFASTWKFIAIITIWCVCSFSVQVPYVWIQTLMVQRLYIRRLNFLNSNFSFCNDRDSIAFGRHFWLQSI